MGLVSGPCVLAMDSKFEQQQRVAADNNKTAERLLDNKKTGTGNDNGVRSSDIWLSHFV